MIEATRGEEKRNDRRSVRTRQALIEAFMTLMLEKSYDTITVQEIIDRANVGRSTFYAHYLDKEDLLHNMTADLLLNLGHQIGPGSASSTGGSIGNRIIPSIELFHHVGDSPAVFRALARGRAIEPVLKATQVQLSQYVEARLSIRVPAGQVVIVPLEVVAQYVAGVLLTLFQWWLDREMLETPEQMDEYFLQLVRPGVRAVTGIEI